MNLVPVDEVQDASRQARELFLDLAGPLRLTDGQGSEWTPTSRKGQGLLALLATSPGLRRSRNWLQDKLWSDRGPTQGAASLRQCLRGLKVSLGPHSDCLRTGFGWIELDPARVCVRTATCAPHGGVEFLEGLDIRDPEFEDWLRDQRMAHSRHSGRSATRAPDPSLSMLPETHRVLGDVRDPDYYGAMVTAAAIAGYLLHARDRPQRTRPPIGDVLENLPGAYAAHAVEIARTFSAFLATHGREVFDRGRALHSH